MIKGIYVKDADFADNHYVAFSGFGGWTVIYATRTSKP